MVAAAIYTVMALMTGKSLRSTAIITSRPIPGIPKKRSIKNAPINNAGKFDITSVIIGIEALRRTCTLKIQLSPTPLARAVLT